MDLNYDNKNLLLTCGARQVGFLADLQTFQFQPNFKSWGRR